MEKKVKFFIDEVDRAAWMKVKGADPKAVLRDGRIEFEVTATGRNIELSKLYDLHPHGSIKDFADAEKMLRSQADGLTMARKTNKGTAK